MKILCVGDPHGSEKVKKIPFDGVDVILVTGDIGKSDLLRKIAFKHIDKPKQSFHYETPQVIRKGYMEVYNSALKILKFLSKKAPVYFVYGNVENSDSYTKKLSKKIGLKLPLFEEAIKKIKNVHVINNKKKKIKGVVVGGVEYFVEDEWVKRFASGDERRMKGAKKETAKTKKFLNKLSRVDVLLCHQPPFGVLDKVNFPGAPKKWQGKHAGSKLILDYIKKKKPKFVFCGHIHEGLGSKKIGSSHVINVGCSGGYSIVEL